MENSKQPYDFIPIVIDKDWGLMSIVPSGGPGEKTSRSQTSVETLASVIKPKPLIQPVTKSQPQSQPQPQPQPLTKATIINKKRSPITSNNDQPSSITVVESSKSLSAVQNDEKFGQIFNIIPWHEGNNHLLRFKH